ncbi:hypothetical protein EWZ96_00075 [Helicobacter pylori]|nr:hypothetical protein [Helicobacter pylori]
MVTPHIKLSHCIQQISELPNRFSGWVIHFANFGGKTIKIFLYSPPQPIYGITLLFGDTVDKNNIKKRYNFKSDTRLPKKDQALTQDR